MSQALHVSRYQDCFPDGSLLLQRLILYLHLVVSPLKYTFGKIILEKNAFGKYDLGKYTFRDYTHFWIENIARIANAVQFPS